MTEPKKTTPDLLAFAKAEMSQRLFVEEPQPRPCVPMYVDGEAPTMIRNTVADQAFAEMVRAAVTLAAAREKHLRSIRFAEDFVNRALADLGVKRDAVCRPSVLPAVGSFHG